MTDVGLTDRALDELVVQATAQPNDALDQIESLRARLGESDQSTSWQLFLAHGLALRSLLRFEEASTAFDRALELAQQTADPNIIEQVTVSRAGNHMFSGRLLEAERDLQALGEPSGPVLHTLAAIYAMQGRFDNAFAAQTEALRRFRKADDVLWQARARQNRSHMAALVGQPSIGRSDARTAIALFRSIGHEAGAAKCTYNLAVLHALAGATTKALRGFAEADAEFDRLGIPREQVAETIVDSLLAASLHREAFETAVAARTFLRATGASLQAAEVTLHAARAALGLGDRISAIAFADEAEREFAAQGRSGFEHYAALVALTAEPTDLTRFAHTTESLEGIGWTARAESARHTVATSLLDANRTEDAVPVLQSLAARTTVEPALHDHAVAELERLKGNTSTAISAVASALARHNRRWLGLEKVSAAELLASPRQIRTELCKIAMRASLAASEPWSVVHWAERAVPNDLTRSTAKDPVLESLSTSLRAVRVQLDQALRSNDATSVRQLESIKHAREVEIRNRRRILGGSAGRNRPHPSIETLMRKSRNQTVIRLVLLDQIIHVYLISPLTVSHVGEFAASRFEAAARRLRTAILRSGGAPDTDQIQRIHSGAATLGELIGPALTNAEADIVIAAPQLPHVPWAFLPELSGRSFSVAPSLTSWSRTTPCRRVNPGDLTAVSGPGLPGARDEVIRLRNLHRNALADTRTVQHTSATSAHVLRELERANVLHVAAHGQLRPDNPEFSSLLLAGGPLTVAELNQCTAVPEIVVLSACGAADHSASGSGIPNGFADRLLSLGSTVVVAPNIDVDDRAASEVMVRFHRELLSGYRPARALANTRLACSDNPMEWLAAHSFSAFGRGS